MDRENLDDEEAKRVPENRKTSETKLRRGGKHCPVCLAPLAKNKPRTRARRSCTACGAQHSAGKACERCRALNIWESKAGAACATCALHGSKHQVVAKPV